MRFEGRPGFGSAKRSWAMAYITLAGVISCSESAMWVFASTCLSPKLPSNHKYPSSISVSCHSAHAQQTIIPAVWRVYGTVRLPSLKTGEVGASCISAMSSSYLTFNVSLLFGLCQFIAGQSISLDTGFSAVNLCIWLLYETVEPFLSYFASQEGSVRSNLLFPLP